MTDQSLTSLLPSPLTHALVCYRNFPRLASYFLAPPKSRVIFRLINFQCPKISHLNFCFQSDRINVKVGKNFKIYLNNLMIKSNYSTITKYCKRQSYEDALCQAVELKL